jgi:hypothetical protein
MIVHISDNDLLFHEGPSFIIQMKLYFQDFSFTEFPGNAQLKLQTGGGYIHDAHAAFIQIAIGQTGIKYPGQIRLFSVLTALFQGNIELMTAGATTFYRHSLLYGGIFGHIGSGYIPTLGAYECGRIVAGDKNLWKHFPPSSEQSDADGSMRVKTSRSWG